MKFILTVAASVATVSGHGHLVIPASTRNGGNFTTGGSCTNGQCFWFSNNVEIPGEPSLPNELRSIQLNVTGQPQDVYATGPWRAPGSTPVYGSGCGVAGGGPVSYPNGGTPPKGIKQGFDGLNLPAQTPVNWKRGSDVEVAWAISANHGGGYSYRLCKADGEVTEECFQKTPLKFAGNTSWISYPDGNKIAFPTTKTTVGTFPAGSEWARDPVPGCYECDAFSTCGAPLPPDPAFTKNNTWNEWVDCCAACAGSSSSKMDGSCPGETFYPEPAPGISGFGKIVWDWSISDLVTIPEAIEPGSYLLSWRWDCEESTQVWQNCADINIV